jgi:hypothetical protein
MQDQRFAQWLAEVYRTDTGAVMDPAARASRMSNCRRVEQYLGDLDRAYDDDHMESLIGRLELSRDETTPRHGIPIDGDLYTGSATLKSAARLYQKFRTATATPPQATATDRSPQFKELDAQLRAALPDTDRRQKAAEIMGRLIDIAAGTIPAAWVLSWRQKRGIFLSLTFYRVFAIDRNRVFIAFTTSDASAELKASVEKARIGVRRTSTTGFLSLEDTTSAYVPASFYFENREVLDDLMIRFARRVAGMYDSTAFSRFHSPVAVEWVGAQIGRALPAPAYPVKNRESEKGDEISELVEEFETWCASPRGSAHLQSYAASRATAARTLAEIRAARDAGEDITDRVLRGVLPHLDTPKNRERGAWISIASAVAGDIRTKVPRDEDEWRRVAKRIFEFIEAAVADPANLAAACASFAGSPESRYFQSGMLTPFLNAIDPVHFAIVNKKSRVVTEYITNAKIGQSLAEYPAANAVVRETAPQIADLIESEDANSLPDGDLYDAFSHWLVSERRFFVDGDEPEPLFSARAFELFALLDADPAGAAYQDHKDDFRIHIKEPFRRLFDAVAERLTPEMQSALETKKNLFSRFQKNDFGRGGVWPYYWGAFYPKESQRVRGTQLFVYASSRYVTFGFFAGEPESDAGLRAAAYLRDAKRLSTDGFDRVLTGYVFGDGSRIDDGTLFGTREDCLAGGDDADLLDIRQILRPDEVAALSLDELADVIAASFRELFPLMRVAIGDGVSPTEEAERAAGEEDVPSVAQPFTLDDLARETGIAAATAAMWTRAIERKGQAIFYGPPGTGKTFVAEKIACHLVAGGDGFTETLQFHPAYTYEDFMEGMRPQSNGATLTYPVVPGRFRSFCERASRRTGVCVLIIDEINRANLARVLGELMYLLEYRTQSVALSSGTRFKIPNNVRIIGTMNTADRSIALVDHALRRRFAFIQLEPDYDVLMEFHRRSPLSVRLAALLKRINATIDRHYRIGISFFMHEPLEHHLRDIWRMEIEPYLEEYFLDDHEKCDLIRWATVAADLEFDEPAELAPIEPGADDDAPFTERRD